VKEIQIFVTVILTPRNRTVIIPNGAISNGNIINYTKAGKVRLDLVFGISYDASIKEARKVLMEVMVGHDKVLKEPAPFVGVEELGDSSVNLAVRPYCAPKDYWDVYFDVMEEGKEALDKANISIPFPQMDVHMEK
jgi:small conductance mechanosensitive channel